MMIYGSFYAIYLAVYWSYYFHSKTITKNFTEIKKLATIEARLNLSISALLALSTVIINLLVSISVFRLLTLMYSTNITVYKQHSCKYFAQASAILISSSIVFMYSYINTLFNSCIISDGIVGLYIGIKSGDAGVCGLIYHIYDNFYSNPSGIVI